MNSHAILIIGKPERRRRESVASIVDETYSLDSDPSFDTAYRETTLFGSGEACDDSSLPFEW